MVGTRYLAAMRPSGTGERPLSTILAWTLVIFAIALVSALAISMVGGALISTGPLRFIIGAAVGVLVLLIGVRVVRDRLAARQGTK
ncbi:MAG: hypothetical protein KY455_11300 [Euryarchaeota archaeon]|nr:hypothetical protein [Euryarchaeota archaeon]